MSEENKFNPCDCGKLPARWDDDILYCKNSDCSHYQEFVQDCDWNARFAISDTDAALMEEKSTFDAVIEQHTGLERCEFDDECDHCKEPKLGAFVSMSYLETAEANFYICGKCVLAGALEAKNKAEDSQYDDYAKFHELTEEIEKLKLALNYLIAQSSMLLFVARDAELPMSSNLDAAIGQAKQLLEKGEKSE